MMFCPKCGSLLAPKEEKGKKVLACSCGYVQKKAENSVMREVVEQESSPVDVVSEEQVTLPLTDEECPECGHGRAYWWTKQTRSSDEPETRFWKCEKCKYTWRDSR